MDSGPHEGPNEVGRRRFDGDDIDTAALAESLSPAGQAKRYLQEALPPPDPDTSSAAPQSWLMPSGVPPGEFELEVKHLTGVWRGGRPQDQLRRIAQYLDDHSEFDLISVRQIFVSGGDKENPQAEAQRIMWGELGRPGMYPAPPPNPGSESA